MRTSSYVSEVSVLQVLVLYFIFGQEKSSVQNQRHFGQQLWKRSIPLLGQKRKCSSYSLREIVQRHSHEDKVRAIASFIISPQCLKDDKHQLTFALRSRVSFNCLRDCCWFLIDLKAFCDSFWSPFAKTISSRAHDGGFAIS